MPELPEVETVRRSLAPMMPRKIASIYLSALAPVETTTPRQIRTILKGSILKNLDRRGKYLLLRTERGPTLVLHLGMSGKLLFYERKTVHRAPHTHMEMQFVDGSVLHFIDARRFGTISLIKEVNGDNPFLSRLGPDYLDPTFSSKSFIARCRRHPKVSIKILLLNQGVAAGLGNIYACEALYQAGLDPRRPVGKVRDAELVLLHKAIRLSLRKGIKNCGISIRDYLDGRGQRGKMQDFLQVYGREGKLTLDKRGRVARIVQQGRATFFCPRVQK